MPERYIEINVMKQLPGSACKVFQHSAGRMQKIDMEYYYIFASPTCHFKVHASERRDANPCGPRPTKCAGKNNTYCSHLRKQI